MKLLKGLEYKSFLLTVQRRCFFCESFFVIYVSCLSYFLVCLLQRCGYLLGKGRPLGSLVCYVLLCFCHFPMWCPGSSVVLDCIDS